MTKGWERKPLGAVADLCLGKMLDQKKNRGEFMPYLANVNVRWGEFVLDDLRTMRFEPKELDRYGLKFGDIVMCEGGEPGRCAIWKNQVPNMMIQKALHRIRPKDNLDYRFLFYNLLHLGQTNVFDQYFTGSTIKHLTGEKLAKVEVVVPPLSYQRCIASFLSAYDDLIKNNTRRISILEKMARTIYEEWFVRFRFPGHEQVKMVESELGMIPEGWSVRGVYDVAEVTYGYPFKSKLFRTDGIGRGVIRIRDIKGNRPSASTEEDADSKYVVSCGDILIGMDGLFHMNKWAGPNSWLNQRVVRLRPRDGISLNFIFNAVRNPIQVLEKTIVGTTVAHLSAGDMKAIRLTVPSDDVMTAATEVLDPLLKLELKLQYKNANLRAIRDLLLPKLISGELDVSNLPELEETIAA